MSSAQFRPKAFAIAVGAVSILAVNVPSVASAAPVRAGCLLNAASVIVSTTTPSTTSTSFVDVVESGARFMQGGARPGCVIVSFSAEAAADPNQAMQVTAVLDGTTVCEPGGIFLLGSDPAGTGTAARAMNFVCTGVTPGAHVGRMRFKSLNGGIVVLRSRTMIVHYFR